MLDAGCSIQDELFASFDELIALSDERGGVPFDRSAQCARVTMMTVGCG